MKSLNRTLSLVLVLVMIFGLMGVASAKTSFTDDATIQYQTAVGTMTGIGAINGYADGTFAPKGNITREEAAKMVAYATLSADVAKTLTVSATGFTDVETGRWSAPFIAYCVSKGIINGLGDGTFNPTGNVTGFELAKMLLCAAGYGKQGEYTGASWSLNVAVDANSKGIFTGTKATSFSAAATREEAALYVYNAITGVDVVKYSKDTASYSPVDGNNISENTYHYAKTSATQIAAVTYSTTKGYTVATVSGYTFPCSYTAVGSKVIVHGNSLTHAVYYVETTTKELNISDMTAAQYKAAVVTPGYLTYSTATVPQFDNYYDNSAVYTLPTAANVTNSTLASQDIRLFTEYNSTTGVTTVVGAQVNKYTAQAVTAVSAISGSESVTLSVTGLLSTATATKALFGDTLAKGDVVLVQAIGGTGNYYAVKAKSVTGAPSAYTYDSAVGANAITVNGTGYYATTNPNVNYWSTAPVSNTYVANLGIPSTTGTSSTFYLDTLGYVIGYTGTTTASTAYVLSYVPAIAEKSTTDAFGNTSYAYSAQVMFADGTYGTYPVASYNGKTLVHSAATGYIAFSALPNVVASVSSCAAFYNATLTSDGKVVLYDLATYGATFSPALANTTAASQVVKGNAYLGNGIYATANTTYFYTNLGVGGVTFGGTGFYFYAAKGYANATTVATAGELDTAYFTAADYNKYAAAVAYTGTAVDTTVADVYYYGGAYTTSVSGTTTTINYTLYKNGVAETYSITNSTAVPTITAETTKGFYVKKAVTTDAHGMVAYSTNVAMDQALQSFGANILLTTYGKYFATDAVQVVDLRTATQIATSSATYGIGKVSGMSDILAAKAAGLVLDMNIQYSTASATLNGSAAAPFGATYIYVTADTATTYAVTASAAAGTPAGTSPNATCTLTATASTTNTATLHYAWYKTTTAVTTGGTAVGTDSATLALTALASGNTYYYCVVTAAGATSATTSSVTVTIA